MQSCMHALLSVLGKQTLSRSIVPWPITTRDNGMRQWKIITTFLALLMMHPVQSATEASMLVNAAAAGEKAKMLMLLERGVPIDGPDHNGKTALIAASQYGHVALVKILLSRQASINARTQSGSSAFYYAAQNHHIPVLKLLHASGANINMINRHGFSALSVAALNGNEATVRLLLDYGADMNVRIGGSPLLIEILGREHDDIFQALLDAGADVNARIGMTGKTPLMVAVTMQHMQAVKHLLDKGADIGARTATGETVLHGLLCNIVTDRENTVLLGSLLDKGAEPDRPASSLGGFADGSTPVMCAVKRDYLQSTRILLASKADVNRRDQEGHMPLYYAIRSGNEDMVGLLLRHSAQPPLDQDTLRVARRDTRIGRMILTALQPILEGGAMSDCPRYVHTKEQYRDDTSSLQQPQTMQDPLHSEAFPAARVDVLAAIPPVGDKFSLSPDGEWLVVREDHRKTPQLRSHRLVIYALSTQQVYFLDARQELRVREDGWSMDSRYYVPQDYDEQIIDVSTKRPRWQTRAEPMPSNRRLYAGGDPCPWRNDAGQVVLDRPGRDDARRAWSRDGKIEYFLESGEQGEYRLMERRDSVSRILLRHRVSWLRNKRRAQMLGAPLNNKAKRRTLEQQLEKIPQEHLVADRFVLSPGGHYLFYRIGQVGGQGFFGLASRHIVVDVMSVPAKVWVVEGEPWGTPQWHPNGHDLYFIDQAATDAVDPDFPSMRQPQRWRLSLARFP